MTITRERLAELRSDLRRTFNSYDGEVSGIAFIELLDACAELVEENERRGARIAALRRLAAHQYTGGFKACREKAAQTVSSYEPHCESCPRGVVDAVLAITPESDE